MLFHFLDSDPVGVDDLCVPTWGIFLFSTCLFVHLSHLVLSPTKGGLSQAQEPHLGPGRPDAVQGRPYPGPGSLKLGPGRSKLGPGRPKADP